VKRGHVELADLPAAVEDERLPVAREGGVGVDVHLREAFLLVPRQRVREDLLGPRLQIAQDQRALGVVAADVGDPLPIGSQHRLHAAVGPRSHPDHLRGHPIEPVEIPETVIHPGKVREAALTAGEVEIASVGTRHRASHVVELVLVDDFDARSPVAMDHHQLYRRDPSVVGFLAARQDVCAVGRPGGRGIDGVLLLGQGARVRPVGVHQEQVHVAPSIAAEGDRLPVG
jgi:hypothetical protein